LGQRDISIGTLKTLNQERINFDWELQFDGEQLPSNPSRPEKYIYNSYFDGDDVTDLLKRYVYRRNSLYLVDVVEDLGINSSSFVLVNYKFVKR